MKPEWTIERLKQFHSDSIIDHLGIELLELGDGYLTARMPVDHRTQQPFGILHGGASVVLAETLGSMASIVALDNPDKQRAVGLEVNANHIRSVSEGWVYGRVTPIHVGRSTHIWAIRITDEDDKLVCVSRLTIAILNT